VGISLDSRQDTSDDAGQKGRMYPNTKKLAFHVVFVSCVSCCLFLLGNVTNIGKVRTSLGLRAAAPLVVEGATVRQYANVKDFVAAASSRITKTSGRQQYAGNASITLRLTAFDDGLNGARLSREWNFVRTRSSNHDATRRALNVSHVRSHANVCVETSHSFVQSDVRCLPSFFIVGFEKCSTTALSIWLSHHPNLQSRWMEGRFFDHIDSVHELEEMWYDQYLMKTLPRIPSRSGMGEYWTFEKSPAYASSPRAPEIMSNLLPTARLLFMTRNPTRRAYSMFLMYTSHYPGIVNAVRGRPLSFFVKNVNNGNVRYVGDRTVNFDIGPGVGGERVPADRLPNGHGVDEEWRFLSFPPDPKDFHTWIVHALERAKEQPPNFADNDNSRPHRLLFGGFYASHIRRWLKFYPPESFVLLPSEILYTDKVLASLTQLQETLGLPLYEYHNIGMVGADSGRFEVSSPAARLNGIVNSYQRAKPMLEDTRLLLDGFYCKENRDLSLFLGGRALPGYACAESTS